MEAKHNVCLRKNHAYTRILQTSMHVKAPVAQSSGRDLLAQAEDSHLELLPQRLDSAHESLKSMQRRGKVWGRNILHESQESKVVQLVYTGQTRPVTRTVAAFTCYGLQSITNVSSSPHLAYVL